MFAYMTQAVLLLMAAVVPADEPPDLSSDRQQYMLVLRRFEVSTASAGILVAGSVSRESAPTLRPFRSLPSGRDLDVISEHVSVVAAEQPQYAVLRRNVLRDWIVKVQADVLIVRDTGKEAVDRRRLQVKQMLHALKSGL